MEREKYLRRTNSTNDFGSSILGLGPLHDHVEIDKSAGKGRNVRGVGDHGGIALEAKLQGSIQSDRGLWACRATTPPGVCSSDRHDVASLQRPL